MITLVFQEWAEALSKKTMMSKHSRNLEERSQTSFKEGNNWPYNMKIDLYKEMWIHQNKSLAFSLPNK